MELEKTLAERIFDNQMAENEAYDQINIILGCDPDDYDDYKIEDDGYDYYDGSVELIFRPNTANLTREQADKILDLGFCRIFESHGDVGTYWDRKSSSKCYARDAINEKALLLKYRRQIDELKKELEESKKNK